MSNVSCMINKSLKKYYLTCLADSSPHYEILLIKS